MTVSDLTQGVEYSFTVAGVDTGNRLGEESLSSDKLNLDGKVVLTPIDSLLDCTARSGFLINCKCV